MIMGPPYQSSRFAFVQRDGLTDEGFERGLVDPLAFMQVDGAPGMTLKARVEQPLRVLEPCPFGEGQLDGALVGLACADQSVVRPRGNARVRRLDPLQLLDDVRVGRFDEPAHPAQGLTAPAPEVGYPSRDELRDRLALARA